MRLIVLLIVIFFPMTVAAGSVCGPRAEIVDRLSATFEESQSAIGLSPQGFLVEVFTSKTGSFTIVYTQPGGETCLIVTGQGWQEIKDQANAGPKT